MKQVGGPKVIFAEEKSLLTQWENMHRPPDPDHMISPSGPGATARGSLGSPPGLPGSLGHGHPSPGIKYKAPLGPGIGGVVGDTDKDRRCSVISLNQTKPLMHFPVKNKKITREKFGDIRRPSDLWQAAPDSPDCCAFILTLLSYLLIMVTLPVSLCMCIKVVQEYERAVIFRLGRLRKGGAKGPGIFFVIPCVDNYRKVDLRTVSFDVPPQEILSRDSVTVTVDAVVYYMVHNPTIAVSNVENFSHSTRLLAATTLRNVLGTKNLSEILSERETISHVMQHALDEATDPWGVKVERVEIKDVRLPVQLQRAMAAEAEAAREARAKVIAAEGEQKASRALKDAAAVIHESPSALQLRYLQTLNSISAEKNSTIIFPFPVDIFDGWMRDRDRKSVDKD